MKTYFIGLVGVALLTISCDVSGTYEVAALKRAQRSVINDTFDESLGSMVAEGSTVTVQPMAEDEVQAQARVDAIQLEFGGFLSLAQSPKVVVPTIRVSRQIDLRAPVANAGAISQEKYLLTAFDLAKDAKTLTSLTFTRINRGGQNGVRVLKLSAIKNDWIEDLQLAKGSANRDAQDVFIDEASAVKIGNLFAALQTRLEEMK